MGKIFGKCANCGDPMFGGKQDGDLKFCSENGLMFHRHPGFCQCCILQTTSDSLAGTFTINFFFGTRLHGWGAHCNQCYSRIRRKWAWFIVPLFPVSAKYRVLYPTPRRYLSRKIKYELGQA